jgi:hypothetical protein
LGGVARLLALACLLITVPGCGSDARSAPTAKATATAAAQVDAFDAPAAFARIKQQVAVGQRPAGSPQLRKLAKSLRRQLPGGRFEKLPGEPGLRNIVADVPGTKPALVVGAHYDTLVKPKGFVGANNGAAGSAIVIELARELAAASDRPANASEVQFVLFDGEEPAAGLPEEQTDFYHAGLRGSRAYVKRHKAGVGAMVLLDYVAGKGLQLPKEVSSNAELWALIRASAQRTGHISVFPDRDDVALTDDHTPFLMQGIPAVDMIDWSYPGHTLQDGLDQLSVASVDAVGETLTDFIARWTPPAP